MAEGTYEYECMRAELLGIEKPNYDEFMEKIKEQKQNEVQNEDEDVENIKEIDIESEGMSRVSGKLDELNGILKRTQSKINKMKASCGSVTSILKNRLGSLSTQTSIDIDPEETRKPVEVDELNADYSYTVTPEEEPKSSKNSTPNRKNDISKALTKDLNNLDAMIEKAEHSQYAMAYQTNKMKKIIK